MFRVGPYCIIFIPIYKLLAQTTIAVSNTLTMEAITKKFDTKQNKNISGSTKREGKRGAGGGERPGGE